MVILAAVALLVAALLILLPTSVHVDTAYGADDVFFSCGTPLTPPSEPDEEPGISECAIANERMRALAALPATSAGVLATVGSFLVLRRRGWRRALR